MRDQNVSVQTLKKRDSKKESKEQNFPVLIKPLTELVWSERKMADFRKGKFPYKQRQKSREFEFQLQNYLCALKVSTVVIKLMDKLLSNVVDKLFKV